MTSFGPIHRLIIHKVGEDDAPFYINEFEDYEVEHPAECESEHDTMFDCERYVCGVQHNIDGCGARFSLRYSGCPIEAPGTYEIQAWAETYRGFEGVDYDGGIRLVDGSRTELTLEAL